MSDNEFHQFQDKYEQSAKGHKKGGTKVKKPPITL
jgi:hypothetical protein